MPRAVLFIDNGGYAIKALYLPAEAVHIAPTTFTSSSASVVEPKVFLMPNCVGAAPHVGTGIMGDQLASLPHYHGLMVRRPVDRGFIVDGGLQTKLWEHMLQHFAITQESEVDVWLTVPFAAPKAVAQLLWALCTRSFRFGSVTFISSSFLALIADSFGTEASSSGSDTPAYAIPTASEAAGIGALSDKKEGTSVDAAVPRKRTRTAEGSFSSKKGHTEGECGGITAPRQEKGGTAIVVDVGFSGTTVIPYVDYLPVVSSIVRLDVGGKLLTNRLKEFLSFSQVNVMDDTWLINYVRERCCVVSMHPWQSLRSYAELWKGKSRAEVETRLTQERSNALTRRQEVGDHVSRNGECGNEQECKSEGENKTALASLPNTPVRFYLPTIPALLPLGVLEAEMSSRLPKTTAVDASALQHLLLCHERFLVPELLFTPGDVGLDQQGLTQAITEGVFQRGLLQHLVVLLRPQLLKRICVFGGVADTPSLCARLQQEVVSVAPVSRDCCSGEEDEEREANWDGDKTLAAAELSHSHTATPAPRLRCGRVGDEVETILAPPPAVPERLSTAIATATAASAPLAASPRSLQPLIGAFHLLTANPTRVPQHRRECRHQQQWLTQLRELVRKRSTVELQRPSSGRVTVETFQEAMRQAF